MNVEGETRPGVRLLKSWINKSIKVTYQHYPHRHCTTMKVEMSDGRVIVGIFLCTDRSGNVIIGGNNCATNWLATSTFSMICFQGLATNIHQTLTRYYCSVKRSKHQASGWSRGGGENTGLSNGARPSCYQVNLRKARIWICNFEDYRMYWTLFMVCIAHMLNVDHLCSGCGLTRSLQAQLRGHPPQPRATQATLAI